MSRPDLGPILAHVDNPMMETRWGLGVYIADRAGIPRRAIGQKLARLEREGLVESLSQGDAPRLWRRRL